MITSLKLTNEISQHIHIHTQVHICFKKYFSVLEITNLNMYGVQAEKIISEMGMVKQLPLFCPSFIFPLLNETLIQLKMSFSPNPYFKKSKVKRSEVNAKWQWYLPSVSWKWEQVIRSLLPHWKGASDYSTPPNYSSVETNKHTG